MRDVRAPREFRDHLRALRRRWWVVAVTAVVLVALALGLSLAQTPMYAATAEVLVPVTPRYASSLVEQNGAVRNQDAKRILQNQVQLIESSVTADKAAEELGFRPVVTARSLTDADVVAIRAESPNPDEAARIANTVAAAYVKLRTADSIESLDSTRSVVESRVTELNNQIKSIDDTIDALPADQRNTQYANDLRQSRNFFVEQRQQLQDTLNSVQLSAGLADSDAPRVINPAVPPTSPFQPTVRRNLAIALVMGLLLGLGLAFLLDELDETLKSKEDFESTTRLVTLATIPKAPAWKSRDGAVLHYLSDPSSPTSEGYRSLRTAIQYVNLTTPIKTLLVTSALPNEGKSTTAANLAVAFAATGEPTAVVSCDLRRPRLHEFFGISGDTGFTTMLREDVEPYRIPRPEQSPKSLLVIPSGPPPPNPSELLASPLTQDLLRDLAEATNLLIIDGPPVLPVSDALVLARYVDAVLVVGRAGVTKRNTASRAVELLEQAGAPVIGMVVIGAEEGDGFDYAYRRYSHRTDRSTRRKVKAEPASTVP